LTSALRHTTFTYLARGDSLEWHENAMAEVENAINHLAPEFVHTLIAVCGSWHDPHLVSTPGEEVVSILQDMLVE
jgi:hypothetical protein